MEKGERGDGNVLHTTEASSSQNIGKRPNLANGHEWSQVSGQLVEFTNANHDRNEGEGRTGKGLGGSKGHFSLKHRDDFTVGGARRQQMPDS